MSEAYNKSIETVFSNADYCMDELRRIRQAWGTKSTFTKKVINASRQTLCMMLLYCPKKLTDLVYATLDELTKREVFLLFGGPE